MHQLFVVTANPYHTIMDSIRRFSLLRAAFWTAALFAFVMAVLPHPPQLPGQPNDKIQHIVGFLLLGALASTAYPRTSLVYLAAALSLFGAIIELVQSIPTLHRDADPVDWMADTAAAALVLIFIHWLRSRWYQSAKRRN